MASQSTLKLRRRTYHLTNLGNEPWSLRSPSPLLGAVGRVCGILWVKHPAPSPWSLSHSSSPSVSKALPNMCSSLGKVLSSEQETQTLPPLTLQSTEEKKHAQIIIPLTFPSHTAFLLKSRIFVLEIFYQSLELSQYSPLSASMSSWNRHNGMY